MRSNLGLVLLTEEEVKKLSPEELQAYGAYLDKQSKLTDLWTWIHNVSPDVIDYPNLLVLCEHLDALVEGRLYRSGPGPVPIKVGTRTERSGDREVEVPILVNPFTGEEVVYNLAISEPPRHGKSLVVSEHLLGYVGTKYPGTKMANSSYGDDLARKLSSRLITNIEDGRKIYGEGVKGGINANKLEWEMENGSQFLCGGRGSGFTGHGWQIGVADDWIKDSTEAASQATRDSCGELWDSSWWTRREPWHDGTPARAILMMTRWNIDDIWGRNVEGNPAWCVLHIPALAEADDPLGREVGEALIPEIMNASQLEELRDKNPKNFAALYQGRPYLEGGNIIHEPFNIARINDGLYRFVNRDGEVRYVPEVDCFRFQVVDLAATLKTTSDWTVVGTFDITPPPRIMALRSLIRIKITTDNHEGVIVNNYRRMLPRFIAVEDKTFGTDLINRLRKRGGINLRRVEADVDKVTRALPIDNVIREEQLWFMEEAAWRSDLEQEILVFPDGEHDDQVDVLAYAVKIFSGIPAGKIPTDDQVRGLEARVARYQERMAKKSRRKVLHPELGRL